MMLYNLVVALAVTRCGVRIDSLPTETLRSNFKFAMRCPWLTRDLCPVFIAAMQRLDPPAPDAAEE